MLHLCTVPHSLAEHSPATTTTTTFGTPSDPAPGHPPASPAEHHPPFRPLRRRSNLRRHLVPPSPQLRCPAFLVFSPSNEC